MKRLGKVLVAMVGAVALLGIGSTASAQVEHCDGHNAPENTKFEGNSGNETLDGVNFDWDGEDLTVTNNNDFSVTVIWCAKGGTNFVSPGVQQTGEQSTTLGPGESHSETFNQDISYIVIYDIIPDDENGEEEEEEEEEEVKEEEPEPAPVVVAEPVFTG